MPEWLADWMDTSRGLAWWESLVYAFILAWIVQFLVTRVIARLTKRTSTDLDDTTVKALRWPLFLSIVLIGVTGATRELVTWQSRETILIPIYASIAIIVWMRALVRIGDAVLTVLARRVDDFKWIEPRSLPLYEIVAKLGVIGGAAYALFLAWRIDVTAWLASAGILGLAIGFAAKDTLANLFAGIFILADAPYQLGDFIILDSGERGRVTDIGIRSTRILTRDDIEITIPNAVIANAKIINETSGPYKKRRVRVDVGVSYDADLEHVREILLDVAKKCDIVVDSPAPSARVKGFLESSVHFQLRGYIEEPVLRGRAVDRICSDIHARFKKEGIEIPFAQRVLHHDPPLVLTERRGP